MVVVVVVLSKFPLTHLSFYYYRYQVTDLTHFVYPFDGNDKPSHLHIHS